MTIIMLIVLVLIGVFILLEILFTRTGQYITNSYMFNPYIDQDECIELVICDPYLKKKSFFVNYKYSAVFERKENLCVTFIQIPLFHRKPRIQNIYINKEKIETY